jgi:hypothetical protein
MRFSARWAMFAIALTVCVPLALAQGRKSVATCTTFDQQDKDDKLGFTIHNACSIPIDCAITWRVVCAPESKTRRAVHPGRVSFTVTDATSQSAEASASACGNDAFTIDSVSWSCEPSKN